VVYDGSPGATNFCVPCVPLCTSIGGTQITA